MAWKRQLILIGISTFLLFCSFTILLQSLPIYAKSLNISDAHIGFVNALFTLSAIFIRPFSGKFMDQMGRWKIFYFGMVLFFVSTLSYLFLTSIAMILLLRFLHGFGWGSASTACSTIATDIIPKEHLGFGIGLFSLSISVALAIAPYFAIEVYDNFGFDYVVWISAFLVLMSVLVSFFIKSEYKPTPRNQKLFEGLYEKAALFPSFLMLCVNISHGSIISFIVIFAKDVGIEKIGLFFTVYASCLIFTRPLIGKIVDKKGFFGVIIFGFFVMVGAFVFLANATDITFALISGFLYAIGFGSLNTSLQTLAVKSSSKDKIGSANATFATGFDGGIFLGSILSGFIAQGFGYKAMYLGVACWLGVVLLVVLTLKNKISNHQSNPK